MVFIANSQSGAGTETKGGPGTLVLRPFAFVGRTVIDWVDNLGAATIFLFIALTKMFGHKQLFKIVEQIYYIGARSITITGRPMDEDLQWSPPSSV